MLAAALVPPALVAGIVVTLALGAWPVGLFANLAVLGVLSGGALWLLAWLSRPAAGPGEARPRDRSERTETGARPGRAAT